MSKPLHVQDTKDLLATLEEDLPEHNLEEDSVVSFLNRFKIVPGDHQVIVKRLYALYKKTSTSVVPYNKFRETILKRFVNREGYHVFIDRHITVLNTEYRRFLKRPNKLASTKIQSTFYKFTSNHNMVKGNDYYPWYEVYYFFMEWRYKTSSCKMKIGVFKKFCEINFDFKALKPGLLYYGINRESIKDYLTDEKQAEIENWYAPQKGKPTEKFQVPRFGPKAKSKKPTETN